MILPSVLLAVIAGLLGLLLSRKRIVIAIRKDTDMAAIDNLSDAVAKVGAYVTSLQSELAATDLSPQIQAAADALNALVPPAADPAPVEPAPVVEQPA